jgi:hypothetical protein
LQELHVFVHEFSQQTPLFEPVGLTQNPVRHWLFVVQVVPNEGSNIDAVLTAFVPPLPPATSTRPFASKVAVCPCTAAASAVVSAHDVPFHSSALETVTVPFVDPPATTTEPVVASAVPSSVAVCATRAACMFPPEGQVAAVPVAGIVNTAVVAIGAPLLVRPPVISTLPFASRVAVCPSRAAGSTVVFVHVEFDVLNSCTVLTLVAPLEFPPAISTMLLKLPLLLVSSVAVWNRRADAMFVATAVHVPFPVPDVPGL